MLDKSATHQYRMRRKFVSLPMGVKFPYVLQQVNNRVHPLVEVDKFKTTLR